MILLRGEQVHVPLPIGRTRVLARTATGGAGLVLLDQEIDLDCNAYHALAVELPAGRWRGPTARRYAIENQRPPEDPGPFTCGAEKGRAEWEQRFDDDGNLLVRLTCRRPDSPAPQLHSLELTFPGPQPEARSYALYSLQTAFRAWQAAPVFEHFAVEATGDGFHPVVAASADSAAVSSPGPSGVPSVWYEAVPGGTLRWFSAGQSVDGVEVVPPKRTQSAAIAVPTAVTTRRVEYRSFDPKPGATARFRLEWSRNPTPSGKLLATETCHDPLPAADLIAAEIVEAPVDAAPLFDRVELDVAIAAQAAPEIRWLRLTRLGPEDAPAGCPTDWITLDYSAAPAVATLCPDGTPPAPWGCGDPPPPLPETGFTAEIVQYEPPRLDYDPDVYITLDRYVTKTADCTDDLHCPGEECVEGKCTALGGQICSPICREPANPFAWPEGCVYRLSLHPLPEPEGPPFYEVIANGFITIWEFLATGWNFVIQGTIFAIANLIPGCKADCHILPGSKCPPENACGTIVKSTVHAGLVALGLPPQAPSVEQLVEDGSDYLVELGADALESAYGVPSDLSRPVIKEGVDALVAELKNRARAYPGGQVIDAFDPLYWGAPSPWHQRHPARVRIRLQRTDAASTTAAATLHGGVLFFDTHIVLPQRLLPGETVEMTVQLEPRIYPPIGAFYAPDHLWLVWVDQQYRYGDSILDLRLLDAAVEAVSAGEPWPGPVAIPTCE